MVETHLRNGGCVALSGVPVLSAEEFLPRLRTLLNAGMQPLAWFTIARRLPCDWLALLMDDQRQEIVALRGTVPERFASLASEFPCLQLFEREMAEESGIIPEGHPWLKPVRFPHDALHPMEMKDYPFYHLDGKEVHEVAVGPVHAGVIEPGHFRFQCHGERVYHLEIQLGWQHRGAEFLLEQHLQNGRHQTAMVLAESIAGDTTIGHGLAHVQVLEALTGIKVDPLAEKFRAVALEMERVAMHLADLGALCGDVAWLPGASWFGELRTGVINGLMALSGSRFGRGWLQLGGITRVPPVENVRAADKLLESVEQTLPDLLGLMFETSSLRSRFERTGVINQADAQRMGLVGLAARASGLPRDLRHQLPLPGSLPVQPMVLEGDGDVMARARIRATEATASLAQVRSALSGISGSEADCELLSSGLRVQFKEHSLAVTALEAWRGQLAHIAVTGAEGCLLRYRVVDPSFHNWFGLAQAVRNNGVSDFPLCNKSFNLSYCGFDL